MNNLGHGKRALIDLLVACLVGQYNKYLVPYFDPVISFVIGLVGAGFVIMFFVDLFLWIKQKVANRRVQ